MQVGLLKAIFLGLTIVYPPPSKLLNADILNAGLIYGKCDGCVLPPSLVEDMCDVPEFLDTFQRLNYIVFGSGPLSKASGDLLHQRNRNGLHWMGQTETELLPLVQLEDPEQDWQYFHFHPWSGYELRPVGDGDLHELFVVRLKDPPYPGMQPVFELFPDRQEHSLQDLFSPHPTKPGLWQHRGRHDDVLVLSNGEKLNPVSMEGLISKDHPMIAGALVVGQGQFQPSLLLELRGQIPTTDEARKALLDQIWPIVERANETSPAYGQITKSLVIFASFDKPFARTPKHTVIRPATVKLYADEIAALYEQHMAVDGPPVADVHSTAALQDYARQLVTEIAHLPQPPDDDIDLFVLGLDSLHVLQIVRAIQSLLRHHGISFGEKAVTPRLVYRNPTVRLLGTAIASITSDASGQTQVSRATTLQQILDKWTVNLLRRRPYRLSHLTTVTPGRLS